MSLVEGIAEMEEGLFVHGLHAAGDVFVALFEGLVFFACGAHDGFQPIGKEDAAIGTAIVPGVGDAFFVVAEAVQIDAEGTVVTQVDDAAHLVHVIGLSVGGEAHDFVFIPIVGEAEPLGER